MTPGISPFIKVPANVMFPLTEFYEQAGLPIPVARQVDGAQIPEPYRSLLVHQGDMTPTLERAYGATIGLRVLQYDLSGDTVSRQVVLVAHDGKTPVAFGAIRIHLEQLPEEARRLVLAKQQPLGTILRNEAVAHSSRPDVFLEIAADDVLRRALAIANATLLYGRRNIMVDGAGRALAEVVEILAPANGKLRLEKNGAH